MTVVVSKKVEHILSISILFFSINDAISSSKMLFPFIVILSLNLIRWGEVYNPTLYPSDRRIEASIAAVEPLPFVPAI